MKVLVTGGAGYIGSHAVKFLREKGHRVVVFDNMEYGFEQALLGAKLIRGDLRNYEDIEKALFAVKPDIVVHFAAYTSVAESVAKPGRYYDNNFCASINLFKAMVKVGVRHIVFSSTSEVYGEAEYLPIDEKHPLRPINPYGRSKLFVEKALADFEKAYGITYMSLRYFNASGADMNGLIGDSKFPPVLLISNAVRGALGLQKFEFTCGRVDTADGSTIRDYIHVLDLAAAHEVCMRALLAGHKSDVYNLGTGKATSTKRIVETVKETLDVDFVTREGKARPGEPAAKYASVEKIKNDLGWEARYSIKDCITSLASWYKKRPKGFEH